MIHQCGVSYLANLGKKSQKSVNETIFIKNQLTNKTVNPNVTIAIQTAYIGEVKINCIKYKNGNFGLLTSISSNNRNPIFVKCIDATLNNLNVNKYYSLNFLSGLPIVIVNQQKCAQNANIIRRLISKTNKTQLENLTLRRALIYNSSVDTFFHCCNFITCVQTILNINNPMNGNLLLSVVNIKNLDNAFFDGESLWIGNGQSLYPLASADVIAHEIGHSIVQKTCDLTYSGQSGALNEFIADCFGTCYEFYIYETFKLKRGMADWLVGEDFSKNMRPLRNMENPYLCFQPKVYQGQYWGNPSETNIDYGYVHTNSGVGNYLFYKISQKLTWKQTIILFYDVLKKIQSNCNYPIFRDNLKTSAVKFNCLSEVQECLIDVNLN